MNKTFFIVCFLFFNLNFSQEKFDIYFQTADSVAYLEENTNLKFFLDNKKCEIIKIQGYCDPIGNTDYNKKLSLKRANYILELFKKENIKISNDFKIESFGEIFKLNDDNGLNRKVTVYFKPLQVKVQEQNLAKEFKTLKKGNLLKIENLNFYNNSANLLDKSKPILDDLVKLLKQYPKLKIEIQGHICCKSKNEPDLISDARAKYIYSVLVENGIDSDRLKYKGYGVSKPKFSIPEKSSMEEEANRRVEILILENE